MVSKASFASCQATCSISAPSLIENETLHAEAAGVIDAFTGPDTPLMNLGDCLCCRLPVHCNVAETPYSLKLALFRKIAMLCGEIGSRLAIWEGLRHSSRNSSCSLLVQALAEPRYTILLYRMTNEDAKQSRQLIEVAQQGDRQKVRGTQ